MTWARRAVGARLVTVRVIVVVTASAATACASLDGLTDGTSTEGGADAHTHDAAASVPDGGGHVADGSRDADARGVPTDAHGLRDVASEASHSYCSSFVIPAGMGGFCEDFDETLDAGAFGTATEIGDGAVVLVQSAMSLSHPNAVKAVTMQVPTGGAQAFLSRPIGPGAGMTYTLEFDALLTPPPAYDGDDVLGGLWFSNEYVSLRVEPGLSQGTLTVNVAERTETEYTDHTRYSVTAGEWARLSLTIAPSGGGFADTLTINGVIVEPSTMLAPSFDEVADPTVQIGWSFVGSPDGLTTYADNVVVLWE